MEPRKQNNESWSEKEIKVLKKEREKYKSPTRRDWAVISKSVSNVKSVHRSGDAVSL